LTKSKLGSYLDPPAAPRNLDDYLLNLALAVQDLVQCANKTKDVSKEIFFANAESGNMYEIQTP